MPSCGARRLSSTYDFLRFGLITIRYAGGKAVQKCSPADPTAPADSSPQLIFNAGALCTAVATLGVFRRVRIGEFSLAAPPPPQHVVHLSVRARCRVSNRTTQREQNIH
jgi:hypothetical protein